MPRHEPEIVSSRSADRCTERSQVPETQLASPFADSPTIPEAHGLGTRPAKRTILLLEGKGPLPPSLGEALLRQGFAVLVAANLSHARQLLLGPDARVDVILYASGLPNRAAGNLLLELEGLPRQPGLVILADIADSFCSAAVEFGAVIVPSATPSKVLGDILKVAADGNAGSTVKRFSRRYKLSDRETEILTQIIQGASPKSIAAEMRCSLQAIYARLSRICVRTACASYPEVVVKLFQFSCRGLHDEEVGTGPMCQRD